MPSNNKTTTKQRNLSRHTPPAGIANHFSKIDNIEKNEIIQNLKKRLVELSPQETIILENSLISLGPDSSLKEALQPGANLLQSVCNKKSFKALLNLLNIPEHALIEVTSKRKINARYAEKIVAFEYAKNLIPDLEDDFHLLFEMAELTGGVITPSDRIELLQWLNFHHFVIPSTADDAHRLVDFLERKPTDRRAFGNYWELIRPTETHTIALDSSQRDQIRKLIKEYVKDRSLLDHLSNTVMGGRLFPFDRSEANEALEALLTHSISMIWAKTIIKDMDWYGSDANHPISDESCQQILLTAILLDLHSKVGEQEPRNHVAGFNLYALEHLEHSFADIRTKFERHLIENHRITKENVALAAHLLLAEAAPEFLVKEVPSNVLLGTAAWVVFCRNVAIQEAVAPGSVRTLSYSQVQHLSKSAEVTEVFHKLSSLAVVDPIINWAMFNGVVKQNDLDQSPEGALQRALAAYEKHAQSYHEAASVLAQALPTRRSIALENLKKAAEGCTFLEDEVFYHAYDDFNQLIAMSPVELHMSNELQNRYWDFKTKENTWNPGEKKSFYKEFPKALENLTSPETEFHQRFPMAYQSHTQAMFTYLKFALTSLPLTDRVNLLRGQLSIFVVRPSVARLHSIESTLSNPIASTIDIIIKTTGRKEVESREEIESAIGRYGVVIFSQFEGNATCYELFTLQGVCRKNSELAKLINEEKLFETAERDGTRNYYAPVKPHQLPTDIEHYTHATAPDSAGSSQGILEKIGSFPASVAPANISTRSYYQSFFSNEFDPLIDFIFAHRPVATYEELKRECWGQTRLEALRAKRSEDFDTFLNIIVPFKACIEDINSDDIDRKLQGAAACTLELALTLLVVIGALGKIASIAARNISVITKIGLTAKVGAGLAGSLLNPLDGVSDLLRHGSKILRTVINGTSGNLDTAVIKLRQFTTTSQFHDIVRHADADLLRLGSWRTSGSSTEFLDVWAIRQNDHWYALNRMGEPWGAKLKGFKPANIWNAFKLDKLMPAAYTRKLLKDALPASRKKIDKAIDVLMDPSLESDSGQVMKMLLGDSSVEGRRKLLQHLNEVKSDLTKVTPDNFILDTSKSQSHAALNPDGYTDWARTNTTDAANKKFMRIYSHNFNQQFRTEGFSHDVLADDIIHELFHGAPDTLDHAYAVSPLSGRKGNVQQLDVAPLMNLASGNYREAQSLKLLDQTKALNNADSFALTTSLLHQLSNNPALYRENISIMAKALERSRNGYIGWEVMVKLNPV